VIDILTKARCHVRRTISRSNTLRAGVPSESLGPVRLAGVGRRGVSQEGKHVNIQGTYTRAGQPRFGSSQTTATTAGSPKPANRTSVPRSAQKGHSMRAEMTSTPKIPWITKGSSERPNETPAQQPLLQTSQRYGATTIWAHSFGHHELRSAERRAGGSYEVFGVRR
jgi:hypothetical protein